MTVYQQGVQHPETVGSPKVSYETTMRRNNKTTKIRKGDSNKGRKHERVTTLPRRQEEMIDKGWHPRQPSEPFLAPKPETDRATPAQMTQGINSFLTVYHSQEA
jgi:hypothetical protein